MVSITGHCRSGDNKGLHGMKRSPGPWVWAPWHSISSLCAHRARPAISEPPWLANSNQPSAAVAARPQGSLQVRSLLGFLSVGVLRRPIHLETVTSGVERHRGRRAWKYEKLVRVRLGQGFKRKWVGTEYTLIVSIHLCWRCVEFTSKVDQIIVLHLKTF